MTPKSSKNLGVTPIFLLNSPVVHIWIISKIPITTLTYPCFQQKVSGAAHPHMNWGSCHPLLKSWMPWEENLLKKLSGEELNCVGTCWATPACRAVDSMTLGMDKEVWEITDTSRDVIQTQGEWELLGINMASPKMSVGSHTYDQIIFYVSPGVALWLLIPIAL